MRIDRTVKPKLHLIYRQNANCIVSRNIEIRNEVNTVKDLVQFNVRVSPKIKKAYKVLALARGIPLERLVNEALKEYLEREAKKYG